MTTSKSRPPTVNVCAPVSSGSFPAYNRALREGIRLETADSFVNTISRGSLQPEGLHPIVAQASHHFQNSHEGMVYPVSKELLKGARAAQQTARTTA